MELCNKGYNSNLKNLLVKHQNNSVYCHRWRLLSGVSLICFYGIILEIFLAELYGWLTPDERAFARLYPWNHEVAIFLGRRRESEVIYRKNCTCRGCFARSGLNTHPSELRSKPAPSRRRRFSASKMGAGRNEANFMRDGTQDSICVNLNLYMIRIK